MIKIFSSIALPLLILFSANSFSQWNTNPAINTPVCTVINDQKNLTMGVDTKGGAIIAWADGRVDTVLTDIYAQRLNAAGIAKWTSNGVPICTDASKQSSVSMTEDGSGGAILVWNDYRNGAIYSDIYAQRIDSSGNILWAANGVPVCMKAASQKGPKLLSDGVGGAIVIWEDSTNSTTSWDIYAQRISSTGTTMWTAAGVPICTSALTQSVPKIQTDGAGGAIIVWQDKRNGIDYDIYTQRINASGVVQWAANGVFVCSTVGNQNGQKIKSDGQGGAIIAWQDKRNSALKNYDIYAQRVNSSGVMQWTANGVGVCTSDSTQKSIDIVTYKVNGAIITWQDKRSGDWDIYSQKVNMNGTMAWAANGIPITTATFKQVSPSGTSDGAGGVILAWQDSSGGTWDVKSQRIDGNGNKLWAAAGVSVGIAAGHQTSPNNVTDSLGGCIYAFQDLRNMVDYDIYAHHLSWNGTTDGINELVVNNIDVKCFPNPFSDFTTLQIINGQIENYELKIFNLFGQEVHPGIIRNSSQWIIRRGTMKSGIYFYEIRINSNSISQGKLILTDNY